MENTSAYTQISNALQSLGVATTNGIYGGWYDTQWPQFNKIIWKNNCDPAEEKTGRAFKMVNSLLEVKLLNITSVEQFIEAVKALEKCL